MYSVSAPLISCTPSSSDLHLTSLYGAKALVLPEGALGVGRLEGFTQRVGQLLTINRVRPGRIDLHFAHTAADENNFDLSVRTVAHGFSEHFLRQMLRITCRGSQDDIESAVDDPEHLAQHLPVQGNVWRVADVLFGRDNGTAGAVQASATALEMRSTGAS